MKKLAHLAAFAALASTSFGAILFDEKFSYADGNVTTVSSSTWANISGTLNPIQVAGGAITGITHGSGSREDVAAVFTATPIPTGNNVFSSFSFSVTTAPTTGADYFYTGADAGTGFRGRVFVSAPTVSGFRLGISNSTATAALSADLVTGATYFAVVRHSNTTGVNSALWIGSSLSAIAALGESSPTITASDALGSLVSFSRSLIRQGNATGVVSALNFDNLVVGNTFDDLAPIPEPSTYAALLGLVAISAVALRRRPRA